MPLPAESLFTRWWRGPGGLGEALAVALPLVVSSLSWTVMTFVDRMFLNWMSGTAMAAAFQASNVWFLCLCGPLGVCCYANTFVSQYYGARRYREIGRAVWQTYWIALLASPLVLLAIPLAPWIFAGVDHGLEMQAIEIKYFTILCWGAPAMLLSQAGASFFSGRGRTSVVMWTDAAYALLNVLLDWLWIFGHFGFPAWGVAGAAWATVVSLWLKAATYLWLYLLPRFREEFGTRTGLRIDRHLLWRIAIYGGPSGLQMVLDVLGFTVFLLLLGQLGEVPVEATSMAFSISTLAFMPVWGVGLGVGVLVGQHLGENRDQAAARSTYSCLAIALGYMAIISLAYIGVPQLFIAPFFKGQHPTDPTGIAVWDLAVVLMRFVAAYNLFDATLIIFSGAVKGAGDMGFVFRTSLVLSLALALASWLAVEVLHLGVFGCWTVITLWLASFALLYVWRFLGGKWRTMRVIEPRVVD